MITNIPTDLLRTLIAVVELRSFTKAARQLGVTQPAVSAQIKRLQFLLGNDLLDKSAPGVALTPTGETVVAYARRLLTINDQILDLATPHAGARLLRLGMPADCITPFLIKHLADLIRFRPELRFDLRTLNDAGPTEASRRGEFDLLVEYSTGDVPPDAYDSWTEDLAWMHGRGTNFDPQQPVPLVADGEDSVLYQVAGKALNAAGHSAELVFAVDDLAGLAAAVAAGIGVTVLPSHREPAGISVWDAAPMPSLPPIRCSIQVRESGDDGLRQRLAETVTRALKPAPSMAASRVVARS